MRLYAGPSTEFMREASHGSIASRLARSFERHFRYSPPASEVQSWERSLRALTRVFSDAELVDHGVILEYQLPLTSKRLDCLVCGRDSRAADNAVIVELKQWQESAPAEGENLVRTWLGGGERETLHPSAQAGQYHQYLRDAHTAFWEEPSPIGLASCAFLHNYVPVADEPLLAPKFAQLLDRHPSFFAPDFARLAGYLRSRLAGGEGEAVLRRIDEGKYRPSRKLMEHVGQVIKGNSQYVLLDEQRVVYESVLASALRGVDEGGAVILVRGGPGTGKSLIALNLMSDLLLEGINAQYVTGSRAFTETLRHVVGNRGSVQFKYFNSYAAADPGSVDVLLCDEAHRIRKTSENRFTPRELRTDKPQVDELLSAARLAVFFIDDRQVVRPNEIGSTDLIRRAAQDRNRRLREYRLEAQFRCAGSEGFVQWIENTLDLARTPNILWDPAEDFDFRIARSPAELDDAIRLLAGRGFTARLTAGFCWPWSRPRDDGTLVPDVSVDGFERPWNARPEAHRLAPGIPRSNLWATDPDGLEQIGCVYTAQGFEFDYVGVIFGPDLVFDWDEHAWRGRPEASHDSTVKRAKDGFAELAKNTYRVLLSRGLKGCYVYFIDQGTERFVRSRIDGRLPELQELLAGSQRLGPLQPHFALFDDVEPFVDAVPVYRLDAAAGSFGPEREVPETRWGEVEWARLPEWIVPQRGMFLAQVIGESMNRRIPSGSWCLFRSIGAGSRQGKVVLAQLRGSADPDTGGRFTVKVYSSEKRPEGDSWRHERVVLRADSTIAGYTDIDIEQEDDVEAVRILAELVAVLPVQS